MRIYLTLCLLAISLFSLAQSVTEDLMQQNFAILDSGEGFVTLKYHKIKSNTLVVNLIDERMESYQENISFQYRNLSVSLEEVLVWENKLCIFFSAFLPGPLRQRLFVQQYDLPSLALLSQKQLMEVAYPFDSKCFGVKLSPNKEQLLVYGWNFGLSAADAQINTKLFNENLEQQNSKLIETNFPNERISLDEGWVSNQRDIFVAGSIFVGNKMNVANPKKYKPIICAYLAQTDTTKIVKIELEKQGISKLNYALDPTGNLIGADLMGKKMSIKYDGLFVVLLDAKTGKFEQKKVPISVADYKGIYPKNAVQPFQNTFTNFGYATQIISPKPKTLVFTTERWSTGFAYGKADYFSELLCIQYRFEKGIDWMYRFPNFDETLQLYQSFVSFHDEKSLYLIYNDLMLNYDEETNPSSVANVTYSKDKMGLIMTKVDWTGKTKSINLSYPIKNNRYFSPAFSKMIAPNKVFSYLRNKEDILLETGNFFLLKW